MRFLKRSKSTILIRPYVKTGFCCCRCSVPSCIKSPTSRRSKGDNFRATSGWPALAGHDRLQFEIAPGGPMTKWVYAFGGGEADGSAEMKNLLGGKGANLAEM